MNILKHLLLIACLGASAAAYAQQPSDIVSARQTFKIEIMEADADSVVTFNNPGELRSRGLMSDMWKAMRTSYGATLTGQATAASADILSSAVGLIVDGVRSKRPDWYAQAKRDCFFTKNLPMPVEIHDFYETTTTQGAMDPNKILFDGFGCTQYYTYQNADGQSVDVPVLYVRCKLKRDKDGLDRILHHGKFEVVVDKFYFNPSICNLPNDSLTAANIDLRTPFDFERRKNLTVQLVATITSSWMNEAIQIVENQRLGQFTISLTLPDGSSLETEGPFAGWYVYDANAKEKPLVKPRATGECFIVPRSFIGTADGQTYERVWGTGQYKIDMTLTEKCEVNLDFYYDPTDAGTQMAATPNTRQFGPDKHHRWNRYWSEEWNKMKKRKKSKGFWRDIVDNVVVNYANGRWVYVLAEPIENVLLLKEQSVVNPLVYSALGLDPAPAAAPKGAQPQQAQGQRK